MNRVVLTEQAVLSCTSVDIAGEVQRRLVLNGTPSSDFLAMPCCALVSLFGEFFPFLLGPHLYTRLLKLKDLAVSSPLIRHYFSRIRLKFVSKSGVIFD